MSWCCWQFKICSRSLIGIGFGAVLAGGITSPALGQAAAYDQPYRPQVHFSPREHWTNDPNGLVYVHGEYHLFFQYNPFGDQWGHMSWGHAISTDLLHWKELPVAIPEANGVMAYTGSIVIDRENTSGLCGATTDCMVAIYTGASDTRQGPRQNQNLAYSRDYGRTWTPFEGNPVLDLHLADFRDPSVSWDQTSHHWVMAVSLPKEHIVRLYSSTDLKQWTQMSDFGPAGDVAGDWECPDLLHIPAADGKGPGTWALKVGLNPGAPQGGSGEQYFLGDFDGKRFTETKTTGSQGWTNYGKDDYCAISFNGLGPNERPVLIGWMSNWQYASKLPTAPWRGQMSLPRRLSLLNDAAGAALKQEPVTAPLRMEGTEISATLGAGSLQKTVATKKAPYELSLRFDGTTDQNFGVRLKTDDQHWTEIGFDPHTGEFYIDRTKSGLTIAPEFPARTRAPIAKGREYDVRLIVDRSSVEAYAQDGTIAMTNLIFPASDRSSVEVFSANAKPLVAKGTIWNLRSVWR